jgi:hypothetical protein
MVLVLVQRLEGVWVLSLALLQRRHHPEHHTDATTVTLIIDIVVIIEHNVGLRRPFQRLNSPPDPWQGYPVPVTLLGPRISSASWRRRDFSGELRW